MKKKQQNNFVDESEILINKHSSIYPHPELGSITTSVSVTNKRVYVEKNSADFSEESILNLRDVQYVTLSHKKATQSKKPSRVLPFIFMFLAIACIITAIFVHLLIFIASAVFLIVAIVLLARTKSYYVDANDCKLTLGLLGAPLEINANMRIDDARAMQKNILKAIDNLKQQN